MALGLFTLYSLTTNSYSSEFYVERSSNSNSMQKVFLIPRKVWWRLNQNTTASEIG